MGVLSKTKSLYNNGEYKELIEKIGSYLRFTLIRSWFALSFKEMHPSLKDTTKQWITYTYFKSKNKKFVAKYKKISTSEHEHVYSNKVWWLWFQGEENAPEIVKRCLESVRKHFSDKEIVVITEKNLSEYVQLPEYIWKKFNKGKITKTHLSDLIRLELLTKYGGIWIDSTVFVTKRPSFVDNQPLFVFKSTDRKMPAYESSLWFIAAETEHPILLLSRQLLLRWWKKHNFMPNYFLINFCFKLASEKYPEEYNNMHYLSDLYPHILQRELFNKYSKERLEELKNKTEIHKLSWKLNSDQKKTDGTFYEKLIRGELE